MQQQVQMPMITKEHKMVDVGPVELAQKFVDDPLVDYDDRIAEKTGKQQVQMPRTTKENIIEKEIQTLLGFRGRKVCMKRYCFFSALCEDSEEDLDEFIGEVGFDEECLQNDNLDETDSRGG